LCYNNEAVGRAESERRRPLWRFARKERKGKDTKCFIPLSPEQRRKLNELFVCDLCPKDKFHVSHRRRWSDTRSLEWDEKTLYFIVDQGSIKEIWKWEYKSKEDLIGFTSLTIETPAFTLSVGEEVILERQPVQLFQEITAMGLLSAKMKLLLDIPQAEPGDIYWEEFFQEETQKTILARLLAGFS
jgi:hypothetical protein